MAIQLQDYTIHDEYESLDTDNERTNRGGYIETWKIYSKGNRSYYDIKGNLPEYINKELAKIAESRGYLYWYNGGKREDAIKQFSLKP
jgi:hypothetical protein